MCKLFFVFVLLCSAKPGFTLNHDDQDRITNVIFEYVDAWNNHAGRGFAGNFSKNGDFINIFGMHFRGKEAVEARHIEILETFLKDSIFTVTNLELREVNPGLVMAYVRWRVDGFRKPDGGPNAPTETIKGVYSHVFIHDNGFWEITATQNTLSK